MFQQRFKRSAFGLGILLLFNAMAYAHPLGNYSINHYTVFELRGEEIRIYHLIDLAEIPSFQEMDLLDVNFDNQISDDEVQAYLDTRIPEFLSNLALTRDGEPLPLKLLSQRLEVYEGSSKMPVFNIFLELAPAEWQWPEPEETMTLDFKSENHPTARGYREANVLLDGRYAINAGPWTDPELKYLSLVLRDEKDNPIFQSFYNRFLLDLSPGTNQPLLASLPDSPDFSWTATARAEEEEPKLLAEGGRTFESSEAPVAQPKSTSADPPTPEGAAVAAPSNPPSKVTVVKPTRSPEKAPAETPAKIPWPMLSVGVAIALALGAGYAVFSRRSR